MRHALNRASRLLAEPRCQRVLVEFSDIHGCRLADKLTTLGVDIQEYLRLVIFHDGSQRGQCGEALAYTTAGSRIVFVCVGSVLRSWRVNPDYLVHSLVHEILHTLGLGENPPASQEITHRVRTLCAGEREIPGH